MALFCWCFVLLVVGPCGLYVCGVLVSKILAAARDPAARQQLPLLLRASWQEEAATKAMPAREP
jgi:hypothetical protein